MPSWAFAWSELVILSKLNEKWENKSRPEKQKLSIDLILFIFIATASWKKHSYVEETSAQVPFILTNSVIDKTKLINFLKTRKRFFAARLCLLCSYVSTNCWWFFSIKIVTLRIRKETIIIRSKIVFFSRELWLLLSCWILFAFNVYVI